MQRDSSVKGNVSLIPSLAQAQRTMQSAAELAEEAVYWERAIREGTIEDE